MISASPSAKCLTAIILAAMQVHRDTTRLPRFRNAVVTIGTFDGVHLGHKKIIGALTEEARAVTGESVIITFHPHPRKIVNREPLQLINTLEEKIELLAHTGVNHLVVVPFTRSFAQLSAEEYVQRFLVQRFRPHTVIIGYDHHFGKDRKGNFRLLQQKSAQYGYRLIEIPKHVLNEADISSTQIRKALMKSDVETANKLLGYDFFFSGVVIPGDRLGRELNYPTANLQYTDEDKIRLGHGVYAVTAAVEEKIRGGMLSVGTRPTLNDRTEKTEVHLFDFNENIYGKTVTVTVKKFLRPQAKFDSLAALKNQMAIDGKEALAVLNQITKAV